MIKCIMEMKFRHLLPGFLSLIAVSCSYEESFVPEDNDDNSPAVFYATIDEQPDADTKVYADENLKVLWNEDDRITIFNKDTYNQQYRFLGEDGDNAGAIKIVGTAGSGDPLDQVYAVYPYAESTSINALGTISFTLPVEQSYHENSFGIGANTMVSVTDGSKLRFKNVGGYLSLKFYGEGVSVSSIELRSNNGEPISGPCTIVNSGNVPEVTMSDSASDQITMVCDPPVVLGATSSEAVQFIFVLPPLTLSNGFTVTVTTPDGGVFEKSSVKERVIGRSAITPLGAMEVVPEYADNIVFADPEVKRICVENWDTDGDGELSYDEAAAVTDLGNVFDRNEEITTFDELQFFTGLTEIKTATVAYSSGATGYEGGFMLCSNLSSVVLPESLSTIGVGAFCGCKNLASIIFPDGGITIETGAFIGTKIESLVLPKVTLSTTRGFLSDYHIFESSVLSSVTFNGPVTYTSYGDGGIFYKCPNLTNIFFGKDFSFTSTTHYNYDYESLGFMLSGFTTLSIIPFETITVSSENPRYDSRDNCNAIIETSTNTLLRGCKNTMIPEGITSIGDCAFFNAGLSSIIIPESVTSIVGDAFREDNSDSSHITSITILATTPPTLDSRSCFWSQTNSGWNNYPIYVPAGSVDVYKTATEWSSLADRIQPIPVPVPEAIDLGLSVKWASFNIGASAPEEVGYRFAWGETEPKNKFSWETYKWCNGTETSLTKYNSNSEYGSVDNKTTLDEEDDAAHVLYGGHWRMPTRDEANELYTYCEINVNYTDETVTFTSIINGNTIVFPMTSYRNLVVWTKSLSLYSYTPVHAAYISHSSNNNDCWETYRWTGANIRAVLAK